VGCGFFFFLFIHAQAQEVTLPGDNLIFDELIITVFIEGGYSMETEVLITDTNVLYLNIESLFKNLNLTCLPNLNGLEGFIENKKNDYSIDFEKKQITIGNKTISIVGHLLEELGIKYIAAPIVSEAFGLNFIYNPRTLSAKMTSSFELPFFKQLRIEKNRKNILFGQTNAIIIDTIVSRNYHLFKFGAIDWSLTSSQTTNNNTSINMGVGTELLFGEAVFSMNYNPLEKFDISQLKYRWRWIDNDNKIIKQAELGQVSIQSVSPLNSSLIGATINNSSTTIKKTSGYYTINDTTDPNWTVELYINDALVDYTLADAAGLYQFKVPVVYGVIIITLKFYGPLGEERTQEIIKNTPYTFTTANNLLYNLTTGVVQDSLKSRFAKVDFNYGVTRNLTINGGLEYLSSNTDHPFLPYAKVAFQPYSKIILNLDYIHNISYRGLINFYVTKNAFLVVDYIANLEMQNNRLAALDVKFSTPIKTKLFKGFTKINYNRLFYESYAYNQINFTMSTYYKQLNINSSSFMSWTTNYTPQMSTNLRLSYGLKNGVSLRASALYNLTSNNLLNVSAEFQKRILKMNLIARCSRNIQSKQNNFSISAGYDLPFSRVRVASSYSNNILGFSESAQGSLIFGGDEVRVKNNSAMSKGAILLYPFLDLNNNGILDNDEKMVFVSSAKVSGGRAEISKKDFIVRLYDLNAFVNYTIEFSDTDLDYVSWRFKHKNYQILIDPNQYKQVYVPVVPVGEVSGTVYLKTKKNLRGQSRVRLQIYDEIGTKVAETMSEFDGYYNYLGLKPGTYSVTVDKTQLKSLNYQALPETHQVTIKMSEYGDIEEGLDFTISEITPKVPKE
jgi:hypothetical protein